MEAEEDIQLDKVEREIANWDQILIGFVFRSGKGRVQKSQARKLSVGGIPLPGASTDEIFPKS